MASSIADKMISHAILISAWEIINGGAMRSLSSENRNQSVTKPFFKQILITFFATIFPSLSAAKLDPIKALKYE